MGSHSVTCHPAEVMFPPLPQPIKTGTRFSDPGGGDARLSGPSWLGYIPRWYTHPKTVTHPSTNRAQRRATSFMRRTTLPLRQTANRWCRIVKVTLQNNNRLTALCPGLPGVSQYQKKHSPTHMGAPICHSCYLLAFIVTGEDNRGTHTNNPAGRHPIQTNVVPTFIIPAIFMHDSIYAIARICHGNSVCPSHGWISQKWLKLGSRNFHRTVAPSL